MILVDNKVGQFQLKKLIDKNQHGSDRYVIKLIITDPKTDEQKIYEGFCDEKENKQKIALHDACRKAMEDRFYRMACYLQRLFTISSNLNRIIRIKKLSSSYGKKFELILGNQKFEGKSFLDLIYFKLIN